MGRIGDDGWAKRGAYNTARRKVHFIVQSPFSVGKEYKKVSQEASMQDLSYYVC